MREDVVITGCGLVTPLGAGVARNWARVKEMETGIGHHQDERLPVFLQYAGRVGEVTLPADIPPQLRGQMKFLNRGSILGFAAAHEAIEDAGLGTVKEIPADRRALFIASGDTTKVGYDFMYPAIQEAFPEGRKDVDHARLNQATLERVNPFFLLESINNNLFSFLSAFLGFMGPGTSLASHSPSGGQAFELACRTVRSGDADIAMAVGCGNWITEIPLYEMEGLGILSRCRKGIGSFRPFDRSRDGFIAGEGGAAVLIESRSHAERRNAKINGSILGTGNAIELAGDGGFDVPSSVSLRSMSEALAESKRTIEDLAFICPHGSGSQKGDRSEMRSIAHLLGPAADLTAVTGLKPYTGHMGAASDLAEVIFGIRALQDGLAPATLNFEKSEPEFRCLRISGSHQSTEKACFLSVSYGIGGQSSSVVMAR